MSKLGTWSPAAGSNNQTVPDGWPEGQLPSTVNDCAREMMASIRTSFLDLQFFDQNFTPTYLTAASFSVPGNQTSAIQVGRRLKLFDATAGVQQIIYATVDSVSFTAVTTVHIEADSGSLTSSLSSFGISIISNNNNGMPRNSDMTVSSLSVTGPMSISGACALNGAVQCATTVSISGALVCNSTLSVSATAVAAVFKAPNTPKAYVRFILTAGGVLVIGSFNVSSVSRSATGCVRITFTNAFPSTAWTQIHSVVGSAFVQSHSVTTTLSKFTVINTAGTPTDNVGITIAGYHS